MRKLRSYTDQPLAVGELVELDQRSAHHLGNVLRVMVGQTVELFNGDGFNYPAAITSANRKQVHVKILSCEDNPMRARQAICLQVALIKPDRMDWLLQKATELGVAQIQLLRSERVNLNLPEPRLTKKISHWQAVCISAAEQCGRSSLPEWLPMADMPTALGQSVTRDSQRIVLHPHQQSPQTFTDIDTHIPVMAPVTAPLTVAIGPEGGFSDTEIQQFQAAGYQLLQLPGFILRAETAALAVLARLLL